LARRRQLDLEHRQQLSSPATQEADKVVQEANHRGLAHRRLHRWHEPVIVWPWQPASWRVTSSSLARAGPLGLAHTSWILGAFVVGAGARPGKEAAAGLQPGAATQPGRGRGAVAHPGRGRGATETRSCAGMLSLRMRISSPTLQRRPFSVTVAGSARIWPCDSRSGLVCFYY
jgi:hypothetical protein